MQGFEKSRGCVGSRESYGCEAEKSSRRRRRVHRFRSRRGDVRQRFETDGRFDGIQRDVKVVYERNRGALRTVVRI